LHHQAAPLKISGSEIRLLLETVDYLDFGLIYFDENDRMLKKKKIEMARAKVCIFRRLS